MGLAISVSQQQQMAQIDQKWDAGDDLIFNAIGEELGKASPDWKQVFFLFSLLVQNEFKELKELAKYAKDHKIPSSALVPFMTKLQQLVNSVSSMIVAVENQKSKVFAVSIPKENSLKKI